jgi:hypothetical protein
LYVGYTFPGKNQDYGMFKKEFNKKLEWFCPFNIFIDLGYLGFDKDYRAQDISIPHKKPRKSKNNPNPQLSQAQKYENKAMSQKRVVEENVIGGMKRYRCLVDRFRNHLPFVKEITIFLAAGLWNFNVLNRV